jgi:hypothetical protein
MVVAGRHKSVWVFIALAAGLISVILLLYVGWVLLNWRNGILVFFGVILLATIIRRCHSEHYFFRAGN